MSDVLFHIKSGYDGSIKKARCKHCLFFQPEYDEKSYINFFGYCSFLECRRVRTTFACEYFEPKGYIECVDKSKQLTLWE